MSKTNLTGNKNSNGWILCPSKTFPGKFYYFNVVNGEAAWSMNESEKGVKKVNEAHKIADKSHSYPEPDTPPIECPEITTTNTSHHFKPPDLTHTKSPYVQEVPIFGQAAFPKYVPNIESCIPSIIWMPIQYPNPVCIPEVKRPMMDQITQTCDANILVQTCGPCSKRFVNYEKPMINFDKNNKILNKDTYTYFVNSVKNNGTSVPNSKIVKPVNFETSTPNKKVQIQTGVTNFKIRKPVFNFESDSNISNVDNGNSTLGHGNKVENCNSHNVKLLLDKNDLRHRLMSSARRKNMAVDQTDGHPLKNTDIKYETQKKRVSFDLSNMLDEETCSITNNDRDNVLDTSIMNHVNTQVSETTTSATSVWYIVVDTDVWLDEHEFIETIVLSDKNCKLLIPHAVRVEIESLSQGECRGQQRVFTARQLARRCTTPPQHYVVEPSFSVAVGSLFTTDSIIDCCIDTMNDNYQVIIISNDPQLHIKAKSNNIPCYKVDDVRNSNIHTQAEYDLKKIKITVPQDWDDISNGTADTLEVSVDSYRTHLLQKDRAQAKRCDSKNNPDPILNYDSDSTTNDIKDLKNLNLKDKNHFSNIKRTVLNLNYVPISNESKDQKDKEVITKTILNSNVDEFHFRKPIPKSNCNNSMFHFQKSVPNSNKTGPFLFQNAAMKYASTQSFDYKKPGASASPFVKPSNMQFENANTTEIIEMKKPETKIAETKEPIVSFPLKNNLNSKFKFNQSDVKTPPSFHQQPKNSVDTMPVLDEQIKNIDLELKKYCVKSKIIDGKIQRRMEEWICSYVQIMEDILNHILQISDHIVNKKLAPPWTLQEAISNMQIIYEQNAVMKYLVQKYSDFVINATCKKGKLNPSMKSNDFMMIFGCGLLLIQQLKTIHPDSQYLVDGGKNIFLLLETIECPIELNTDEFDMLKTPVVCRSEIEEEEVSRSNFIKEPSYVIDYLKKYYKEWESYVFKEKKKLTPTKPKETKILRTFGKNLNMLKIDNNKSISLVKSTKDNPGKDRPKTIRSLNNNQPVARSAVKLDETKIIKLSDAKSLKSKDIETKKAEPKMVKLNQNNRPTLRSDTTANGKYTNEILKAGNAGSKLVKTIENNNFINDHEKKRHENLRKAESKLTTLGNCAHGNTILPNKQENAGPKVMLNTKSLEIFKKEALDLDLLDYSEINDSFTEKSLSYDVISISCDSYNAIDFTFNEKRPNNNCNNDNFNVSYLTNNENTVRNNEKTNENQDVSVNDYFDSSTDYRVNDISRNDSCTNDSGFENDSTYALSVVKIFFTDLSDSFKNIHKFITHCVKEINHDLSEERKNLLRDKAAKCLKDVSDIIQKMNSIISRELDETSALRTLLLGAGIEASADKRISRYRQFVMKCVEQARILSNALKIIVSLTGDVELASTGSESESHRYFNIFDITS